MPSTLDLQNYLYSLEQHFKSKYSSHYDARIPLIRHYDGVKSFEKVSIKCVKYMAEIAHNRLYQIYELLKTNVWNESFVGHIHRFGYELIRMHLMMKMLNDKNIIFNNSTTFTKEIKRLLNYKSDICYIPNAFNHDYRFEFSGKVELAVFLNSHDVNTIVTQAYSDIIRKSRSRKRGRNSTIYINKIEESIIKNNINSHMNSLLGKLKRKPSSVQIAYYTNNLTSDNIKILLNTIGKMCLSSSKDPLHYKNLPCVDFDYHSQKYGFIKTKFSYKHMILKFMNYYEITTQYNLHERLYNRMKTFMKKEDIEYFYTISRTGRLVYHNIKKITV
ncbi:MAG: hypothetical protein ACOCRX_09655 [Candidatus Woesearchaeota archaeon]